MSAAPQPPRLQRRDAEAPSPKPPPSRSPTPKPPRPGVSAPKCYRPHGSDGAKAPGRPHHKKGLNPIHDNNETKLARAPIPLHEVPADAEYGRSRSALQATASPSAANDRLIAPPAAAIGATPVTANPPAFQ